MATGTSGSERPDDRDALDVRLAGREESLISFAAESGADTLTVTVGVDRSGRRVRLDVGEDVEVVWRGPDGLLAVPTELVAVTGGEDPRWVLRPVGPATEAQRRDAVRAPVLLPIELVADDARLTGETLDISEVGLRCVTQAPGPSGPARPAAGTVLQVSVTLEPGQEPLQGGAVVRRASRRTDRHVELSLEFVDLPERSADRVRARVFTELRLLRSRGAL